MAWQMQLVDSLFVLKRFEIVTEKNVEMFQLRLEINNWLPIYSMQQMGAP